jgi:hypothetical protein
VAILVFIGDLLALQKACSFASHGHRCFCWYCNLERTQIEVLDPSQWSIRNGFDVRNWGQKWCETITKVGRETLFNENGIQWSSLMELLYRDCVCHNVLGLLHNFLEGVVQHHIRKKLGVDVATFTKGQNLSAEPVNKKAPSHAVEEPSPELDKRSPADHFDLGAMDINEDEMEDLESKIADLVQDMNSAPPPLGPRHLRRFATSSSLANIAIREQTKKPWSIPLQESKDSDYILQIEDEADWTLDFDSDSDNNDILQPCAFNNKEMSGLHHCITDAVVPSHIACPPRNLGKKSHGKLKADQWQVLATIFLPLYLPVIWGSGTPQQKLLLENFWDLLICTNIICSFKTSDALADKYTEHYIRYWKSLQKLFPESGSVPNHHYAMHNGPQMKFWGPLMYVSEFRFEQLNGCFQNISMNNHMRMFYFILK